MNILVVDDGSVDEVQLRAELARAGHTVLHAASGAIGLALLQDHNVDVVVADILLPNMEGYRLCDEIRQSERFRDLPFIAYTESLLSGSDGQVCLDMGADRYVRKPASTEVLLAALEEACAGGPRSAHARPDPLAVLREYNRDLVARLEEKNAELIWLLAQSTLQTTALETAASAIVITDQYGIIEWVNPAFTALTGYSPEEAIGNSPRILRSGHHDGKFYKEFWRTIKSGRVWRGEFTNRSKDGRLYHDEHTITPVKLGGDEITHYVAIMHDVSERKQAEEDIRSAHNRLNHLLAHSPAILYAHRIEGDSFVPYLASENVADLLGYEVSETLSMDWFRQVVHPDDLDRALASIPETMKEGTSTTEYRVRHRDGRYLWLEDKRRLVLGADGQPSELVGVWIDVTARHTAEEELRESQARLRLAMQASNVGQWDWDILTNEVYFSPEWKSQLGYEDHELDNDFSVWLSLLHPDDVERTTGAVEAFRADPSIGYEVEFRLRHKDGSYRWIHTRATLGEGPSGKESRIYGCHVDITERVEAETFLRTSNEQLEARVVERTAALASMNTELTAAKQEADRANLAKSDFLSRMSHELRTPMNSILGYAQLLEMEGADPRQLNYATRILKGGRHLLDLINEVLELSRIEADRMELSIEPVSIAGIVVEVVNVVEPMAQSSGIRIVNEAASSTLYVHADHQRFRQVVMNLLSNAIKYNREGGKVTVSTEEEGISVRVDIADNGIGIPAEMEHRLFNPFERLGVTDGSIEGTGLGLSVSRKLCEAMGGTIRYRAAEGGKGSVFSIVLPRSEPLAVVAAAPAVPEIHRHASVAGTILYIEDNRSNVEIIQEVMSRFPDLTLLVAMQGRLGLDLAHEHRPDLILLDLHLPDIDGSRVLAELKEDPDLAHTAVIMLSADATESQIERLLGMGANAYITKPFNVAELIAKISELMGTGKRGSA